MTAGRGDAVGELLRGASGAAAKRWWSRWSVILSNAGSSGVAGGLIRGVVYQRAVPQKLGGTSAWSLPGLADPSAARRSCGASPVRHGRPAQRSFDLRDRRSVPGSWPRSPVMPHSGLTVQPGKVISTGIVDAVRGGARRRLFG